MVRLEKSKCPVFILIIDNSKVELVKQVEERRAKRNRNGKDDSSKVIKK